MKIGSIVQFKKYAEEPPANPLAEGTMLKIVAKGKDKGSFNMRPFGVEDDSQDVVLYDDEVEDGVTEADAQAWLDGQGGGKKKGKKETKSKEKTLMQMAANKGKKVKAEPKSKLKSPAKAAKEVPAKKGKLAKGSAKAPAKGKKEKVEKEVKEEVAITYTKDVEKVMRGKSALEAVHELEKGQRLSNWTLGGVLSKIKREKLFLNIGDGYDDSAQGFTAFVNENLDTEYRTAMAHIAKYEHFRALGVTEERVANVKWSKLDMLISVTNTPEEADKWLTAAESDTQQKLFEKVQKQRIKLGTTPKSRGKHGAGNGGDNAVVLARMSIQVFDDQMNVINKAIVQAKDLMKQEGEISDSQAMFFIVSEWLRDSG